MACWPVVRGRAATLPGSSLAAGLTHKDVALLMGRHNTPGKPGRFEAGKGDIDAGPYALALSILLGVPLETLLYSQDELANIRRRVERLRRRFGLPGPSRKADAA